MRVAKVRKEIRRSYSFANTHGHWSREDRGSLPVKAIYCKDCNHMQVQMRRMEWLNLK